MASGGGSKELKAALKKAKEAIKGKDFQQALEHSKHALSLDPKHYNALIFLGKSATELGQGEEAEKAYREATDIDPKQTLAWQGLSALYEKIDIPKNLKQLVGVYQQLMKLSGDKSRETQIAEKLADLYQKLTKPVEACGVLHSLLLKSEDTAYKIEKWSRIIGLLSQQKSLDESSDNLLKEAYTVVLEESSTIEDESLKEFYKGYIGLQLKGKTVDIAELKATCSKMHEMFPTEIYPLEKLTEIIMIETFAMKTSNDWSVYGELQELDSDNKWALIGQGQLKLTSQDFKATKELLTQASQKLPNFPLCWLFLAQCQLYLHDYRAAEQSAEQGRRTLKFYKHPALNEAIGLHEALRVLQGRACMDSGLMAKGLSAVEIFKKLLLEAADKDTMYKLLTEAHLLAGDIASAQQSFEMISYCLDESDTIALDGWLRFHQGDLSDAQKKLQIALAKEEKAIYHYWLGRVYWAMGGQAQQDKSKSSLLKAAKLDINFSDSFLYVGHHYMQIGKDTVKAKRCYKKAYDLNPDNEAAAQALGDAYDLLDEKEDAIAVYTAVTKRAALGGAKWAWLRLGLVQLRAGNATEAVECFQAVLRADPDDIHCQECLAEAYLSRGSNTAALKTFSRIVEMDPNSTYALFKIGHIKQTVGLYSEAVADYQIILGKTPDYVPALSGQGETYILMAKAALFDFFNARAVSYIQNAITVLTRAVLLRPDLCSLWKLLGDACTLIAPLHDNLIRISVNGALTCGDEKICETLGKGELLALGGRCFGRAVQRQKDRASLWHDLGMNYFRQHQYSQDAKMVQKAMQFIQKAIKLDESNHLHWTALGVVAASKAFDDPRLAQHAFIKSIQLEAKNVVAWTNLGTLYLTNGNLKLANQAFAVSQSLEPNHVQCWIGQGLVAETLGRQEAIDLYRHTTELTTHVESGLGYADLVCSALLDPSLDKDSELYRYNVIQMGAVPAAAAAVGKVADRLQVSGEAHTLHGLLQERQGLHRASEESYKQALHVLKNQGDEKQINIALSNHGRALSSIGKAEEARDTLRSISPLVEIQDILQLALALYQNKEWQEAYMAYEQALQLVSSDCERSQILTALAMVSCQSGDLANAKTLLFQSSQLSAPSHQGLVALCALGLQTQDMVLTQAALSELAKQPNQQDLVQETAVLASATHYLQGDIPGVSQHLMNSVEEYPDDSHLWNLAAELMLLLDATNTEFASTCSEKARRLIPTHKNVLQVNAAARLCSGCHGNSSRDRLYPSLIAAQKAVHAMPGDMNNWALLGACCSAQSSWQHVHQEKCNLIDVNLRVAKFLLKTSKADSKLAAWVSLHNVFCLLQSQQWNEAKELSERLLEWCNYGEEINANLTLLRTLSAWMATRKEGGLESLRSTVTASQSSLAWQTLGKIYCESKMVAAAEACYKQCLTLTSGRGQIAILHQLAYQAILGLKAGDDTGSWGDLAKQTVDELNKQAPKETTSCLLKGLLCKHLGNQRQSRRELQRGMESNEEPAAEDYTRSVIRVHLVEALMKKDKEAAQVLVEEALEKKDPFSARLEELFSA
ncbi:tetratricopeptide repeat protein 37 [Strongylocentrotus purpuratus]|uniref:Tetratricopeptide repeat protein 37 n=1 Tax=Strongylocentrotus purpuratus TaxID=7668 RepID=A0A7M7SUT8_STRPU|nr:tetratricopeptide repeat protein 37 [Strongylocentrotus purpuratus]